MRRLILVLCLVACGAAQAAQLRVPQTGKHAFLVELPKGWHTKPDARGGLLLVPPAESQHVIVYLAIVTDAELRGAMDVAVAAKAGRAVGMTGFDKQEPARITDRKGAVHGGTAFYGKVPEKHGRFRRAKIVIIPLAPDTWAQAWTVAQAGVSPAEQRALDAVLDSLMLVGE